MSTPAARRLPVVYGPNQGHHVLATITPLFMPRLMNLGPSNHNLCSLMDVWCEGPIQSERQSVGSPLTAPRFRVIDESLHVALPEISCPLQGSSSLLSAPLQQDSFTIFHPLSTCVNLSEGWTSWKKTCIIQPSGCGSAW